MNPRIRQAIIIAGVTQTRLAEQTGIPLPTLHNWISGRVECPPYGLAAIAAHCGVSLDWLKKGKS